jgi:hypothetical protein
MPDWLKDSIQNGAELSIGVLATRIAAAFVLGCIVAAIYALTRRKDKGDPQSFITTIVLLTILIAMVTLVIGNSVARAFSLVGALAIVRFRTVVQDTRDTAFVIFAVVVGMAAGAGYFAVPALGIPVVAVAAMLFRPRRRGISAQLTAGTLTVQLDVGVDPDVTLKEVLDKHLARCHLNALGTAQQGASLEVAYIVQLRPNDNIIALISELRQTPGVQGVKFRQK